MKTCRACLFGRSGQKGLDWRFFETHDPGVNMSGCQEFCCTSQISYFMSHNLDMILSQSMRFLSCSAISISPELWQST